MKSQCNLCAKILFTLHTSIEFRSHGDMSVPSPWMNSDVTSYYAGEQAILNDGILISVSSEILKRNIKTQ